MYAVTIISSLSLLTGRELCLLHEHPIILLYRVMYLMIDLLIRRHRDEQTEDGDWRKVTLTDSTASRI